MERMKIGIIKEGKTPPDKRVPISPEQCEELMGTYPLVDLCIQRSDIRKFSDEQYEATGVQMVDDLSDCDVIMGVKEVPMKMLIPNKTYFFFSHTIKEQPYNRILLQTVLEQNIRLIDWETLTNANGVRLIGFGRYAGIVGCYNGFLAYGKKYGRYDLKPAHECADQVEMEEQYKLIDLPNIKIAITGGGRVAKGAMEVLNEIGILQVSPEEYYTQEFDVPVYTKLHSSHYYQRSSDGGFDKAEQYAHPELYSSYFMKWAKITDLYVACHYWDSEAPFLFTREDAKSPDFKIGVIADVSCDIDGPVASTIRPSTIANPIYGYDPINECECDFMQDGAITVMAVDNLPCELPMDASRDFGSELMASILPALLENDPEDIIGRATVTKDCLLTEHYAFLQDYVDGVTA